MVCAGSASASPPSATRRRSSAFYLPTRCDVPRTQVHAPSASGLFDTVPCPVRQYGSYAEACAAIRVVGERIAAGGLPPSVSPLTIAIHGTGNVGRGALHALRHLGDDVLSVVKTPAALAHVAGESASHRVFAVVLSATDVVMPLEPGAPFERAEYYAHPERYRPVLHELLSSISLLIHCAGWDMRYPRLLTAAQLATSAAAAREAGLPHAKLQMIADVSCDLPGALESLVRTTTSRAPFYIYDPVAAAERVCPAGGSGATEMRGIRAIWRRPLPVCTVARRFVDKLAHICRPARHLRRRRPLWIASRSMGGCDHVRRRAHAKV
mmetsp:Transcript_20713/g.49024  ORF Transcript_20713/g.49024 Transcript_20713/m.49024 type:complete len:324 (+) Transcript_20713:506-1477(+)